MGYSGKIQKILTSLQWEVRQTIHSTRHMEITSDPWARVHTIYLPPPGRAEWRDIELLHELAHAWLAERVHPLFGTAYFVPATPPQAIQALTWPKRTADDWFVDHLLMQWCPEDERAEIAEHVAMAGQLAQDQSPFALYSAGFLLAQAQQYRVGHPAMPQPVKEVAKTIRRIRPDQPTLRNLVRLTNRLAAFTTTWRVRLAKHEGVEVLEAYKQKGGIKSRNF